MRLFEVVERKSRSVWSIAHDINRIARKEDKTSKDMEYLERLAKDEELIFLFNVLLNKQKPGYTQLHKLDAALLDTAGFYAEALNLLAQIKKRMGLRVTFTRPTSR